MRDLRDGRTLPRLVKQKEFDSLQYGLLEVRWCRRDLVRPNVACIIGHHQVGERAAYICPDPNPSSNRHSSLLIFRGETFHKYESHILYALTSQGLSRNYGWWKG